MTDLDLCVLANDVYDNPNVQGGIASALVVEQDGYQVFAFAGSKDFEDFLFDGAAIPAPMEGLGDVHKGFRDEYFMVRDKCLQLAIASPLPKIMIGHSLGATQAQYCAWDFGRILKVEYCVTFGCPRAFTASAMANYSTLTRNYIHGQDAVPDLPPYFHRPGEDIFLDEVGNRLPSREPREPLFEELRDRVKDHLLEGHTAYINAVGRFLNIA